MQKVFFIIFMFTGNHAAFKGFDMPHNDKKVLEAIKEVVLDYCKNISTSFDLKISASSDGKGKQKLEDGINKILYWLKDQVIAQVGYSGD